MDILGIGPLELLLVLIVALVVLGPNDMIKAGRTLGKWLRRLVLSPEWRTVQQTSNDLRNLPNKLIREAGLDELKDQMPTAEQIRDGVGYDNLRSEMQEARSYLNDASRAKPEIPSPLPPTLETPGQTETAEPGAIDNPAETVNTSLQE